MCLIPSFRMLVPLAVAALLAGCGPADAPGPSTAPPPVVKTLPAETAVAPSLTLSGTIRATREGPLSFQIGGRIDQRFVKSGDLVKAGDALFGIDTRDLKQALSSARAEVTAARSALENAQEELARNERLFKSKFISEQALDRFTHQLQEAKTRLDAAASRAQQAEHALGYATLRAPGNGIVVDTLAEIGQVVAPGQPVAQFAHEGLPEIEVFLPQGLQAPATGVVTNNGQQWPAVLREVSGAADAASRTVRARYTLSGQAMNLPLGAVARLTLTVGEPGQSVVRVPLGALDERGQGAQVWVVVDGKVRAVPVQVLSLSDESAQVQTSLVPGTPVVATGTHLLQPDMPVRVQAR